MFAIYRVEENELDQSYMDNDIPIYKVFPELHYAEKALELRGMFKGDYEIREVKITEEKK